MSQDPNQNPGCATWFGAMALGGGDLALAFIIVAGLILGIAAINWDRLAQQLMNQRPAPQVQQGPGGNAAAGAGMNAIGDLADSFITSGSATASVGGALTFSGQISADPVASYIQRGMAWLSFIDVANRGAGEILVVLNEPEDSVTVAQGDLAAIGQDDDCTWNIQVTESTVSGTVSCAAAEVWRNTSEATGTTASIQLQFSTTLTPMDTE